MKALFVVLTIFLCFLWVSPGKTTNMSGGDFEIVADAFTFADVSDSEGGNFVLQSSGDPVSATSSEGGNFVLLGGFLAAEPGSLSFSLDSNSIALGTLTTAAVSTGSVTMTVTTISDTGYTVSISEDGNLRTSGGADIDDASGVVTAGSEAYGISTSGADGLLASDTAISGAVNVASNAASVSGNTVAVTFSASKTNNTPAGDYSHVVTFTATVNP